MKDSFRINLALSTTHHLTVFVSGSRLGPVCCVIDGLKYRRLRTIFFIGDNEVAKSHDVYEN